MQFRVPQNFGAPAVGGTITPKVLPRTIVPTLFTLGLEQHDYINKGPKTERWDPSPRQWWPWSDVQSLSTGTS